MVMDIMTDEIREGAQWTMMLADDIMICGESKAQVEEKLEIWRYALERREVRKRKTKYMCVYVVVRLEHSHSCNDSLDNHSTASGPAWCRRCRPPGNAVSGHSSTMCLVVWWSPQGQAGDAITPHPWRDSAHLAWPHLRLFSVTNWRIGRVNPGCGHVGSVTRSCPGGTP